MKTYALRCIEADLPQLIANADLLGVTGRDEGGNVIEKNGGMWDYIGYKLEGEPPAEGQPDTRGYAQDANGNKYVHINVRTPVNVAEVAAALAVQYPQIAEGLSQLGRFFITDENGETTWPLYPIRTFA